MRHRLTLLFCALGLVALSGAAEAQWVPPIGIPAPSFGITETAPAFPSPWTTAITDRYYVCQTCPGATNTNNPYGWPAQPRFSIPNPLIPVSGPVVVQVVGLYTTDHSNQPGLSVQGTVTRPVFIRGTSNEVRATITKPWWFENSSYVVFEYFNTQWVGTGWFVFGYTVHHLAIRHNSFIGDGTAATAGLGGSGVPPYQLNNIVIWDNVIGEIGDWQTNVDEDHHGVILGQNVSDIWVVDNTIYHTSGNGMQAGSGTNTQTPASEAGIRIYVGRNHVYETKQDGLWTKQATDVIFSQNLVHGIRRDSGSSNGACLGGQYGPEYVWYIYNRCYDSHSGIVIGSAGGFGEKGYIIGNVISGVRWTTEPPPNWSNPHDFIGIAVSNRGFSYLRVVNNTFHDYDGGFYSPAVGLERLHLINNIFSGRNTAVPGFDVFREFNSAASTMKHNNFQNFRLGIMGFIPASVAAFQAAMPSGTATGNLSVDPLFVGPTDFHLQSGSPMVGAGQSTADAAFSEFATRYGLSIQVDYDAVPRPIGVWDIGALEYAIGTRTLTIAHSGTGTGTTTPPAGSSNYVDGAVVVLAATPASGSSFAGWTGTGCTTGTVAMTTNRVCTATFNSTGGVNHALTIAHAGTGTGTTTPNPGTYSYVEGTVVTLAATPTGGGTFAGWTGTGCSTGAVTMSAARTCTATFNAAPSGRTLVITTPAGSGSGVTVPSPGSYAYADGTVVTLSATPNGGSLFTAWSGLGCTSGVVTMSQDRTCTATFQIQDSQTSQSPWQFSSSSVYVNASGDTRQHAVTAGVFLNDLDTVAPGVPVIVGIVSGNRVSGTYAVAEGYVNDLVSARQYGLLSVYVNESVGAVPVGGGGVVVGGTVAVGGGVVQ